METLFKYGPGYLFHYHLFGFGILYINIIFKDFRIPFINEQPDYEWVYWLVMIVGNKS